MSVIVINGIATAGKDTFMDLMEESFPSLVIKRISAIDLQKKAFCTLGWNGEKSEEFRKYLSDMKLYSDKHFDTSYKYITDNISKYFIDKKECDILFVCVRDADTIKRCVDFCRDNNVSCIKLLIERSNIIKITSNDGDRDVYNTNYDITIDNSGTLDELKEKIKAFKNNIIQDNI